VKQLACKDRRSVPPVRWRFYFSQIRSSFVLPLIAVSVIAGCSSASVQSPGPSTYNSGAPVGPRESVRKREDPFSTRVVASWYGPGYEGRRTANGENFNPNDFTAASRTLPLGSIVRVTNLKNGRSVIVRINDRGPVAPGRSIDLSSAAAQRIGLTRNGVGRVRVTRLSD
jgi:rare lipoprotein A